jgi:hypothetical protein
MDLFADDEYHRAVEQGVQTSNEANGDCRRRGGRLSSPGFYLAENGIALAFKSSGEGSREFTLLQEFHTNFLTVPPHSSPKGIALPDFLMKNFP